MFSYVTEDLAEGRLLLQARRAVLPSLEVLGTWLTDDVCVPRTEMAALIAACEQISADVGLTIGVVGHAGDGNMHPTIVYDASDPAQLAAAHDAFGRILDAGRALGGTVTGEHGIGRVKQDFLRGEIGELGIEVHRAIKRALDPEGSVQPRVDVRVSDKRAGPARPAADLSRPRNAPGWRWPSSSSAAASRWPPGSPGSPGARDSLGLGPAELGLLLLCLSAGSVAGLALVRTDRAAARTGGRGRAGGLLLAVGMSRARRRRLGRPGDPRRGRPDRHRDSAWRPGTWPRTSRPPTWSSGSAGR